MSGPFPSLVVAAGVLAAALLGLSAPAHAGSHEVPVSVTDGGYHDNDVDGNGSPTTTRVHVGQTVVWTWLAANERPHTVTSLADSGAAFDSDRPCEEDPERDPAECRGPGYRFAVTFSEPGTFRYGSEVDVVPMLGTIEVVEAPQPGEEPTSSPTPAPEDPSEDPPPSEQPSEEPSSEPSPSPEPSSTPGEEGGTSGNGEPQDPGEPTPTGTASSVTSRRASRPSGLTFAPAPSRTFGGDAADPAVAPAVPKSTLRPFPEPSTEVDAADDPAIDEDLAVDIATGERGPDPVVVRGVAVLSVLGAAGAFAKLVLFGGTWL